MIFFTLPGFVFGICREGWVMGVDAGKEWFEENL
jgi:hypothetical protein